MENGKSLQNISPEIISSLVLGGDVSKLTAIQKVQYYNKLCEEIGLNPLTQPFKLLKLQGKEVLYADKGATQQLCQIHNISTEVIKKERFDDVYCVTVRAKNDKGRFTDEDGVVSIGNLKGDMLANALMKAMTKAKRRAVLALCGLGMLDETEIETIPNAIRVEKEEKKFAPPPIEVKEDVIEPKKELEKTLEQEYITQADLTNLIATAIKNKYTPEDIEQKFESLGYKLKSKLKKSMRIEEIGCLMNTWDYDTLLEEVSKEKRNDTKE